MNFEEAQQYFAKHYEWQLHQETFQALNARTWISKVTTAFRVARGETEESTFYLIYNTVTHQHYLLDESALPGLIEWCFNQKEGTTH
jgi:hypothetical protein